jgi:hypothetical protein
MVSERRGSRSSGSGTAHRAHTTLPDQVLLRSRHPVAVVFGAGALAGRGAGRSLAYFPKEFVVALLFAAASALPAWDEARRRAMEMPRHHPLLLLCPIFAALCWLNCVAIEDWEQHRGGRRIQWLAVLTIAASSGAFFKLMNRPTRSLAVATILSAVIFLALDRCQLKATGRRIAADLALLTPLLSPVAARLTR